MSVGVVLPRPALRRAAAHGHRGTLLDRTIAETPGGRATDARRRAASGPCASRRTSRSESRAYAGDRWLLAGDAGSFLDPVFSTGVAIALESGLEAAQAVDRGLAAGDLSARRFATLRAPPAPALSLVPPLRARLLHPRLPRSLLRPGPPRCSGRWSRLSPATGGPRGPRARGRGTSFCSRASRSGSRSCRGSRGWAPATREGRAPHRRQIRLRSRRRRTQFR